MKKIIAVVLIIITLCSFISCSQESEIDWEAEEIKDVEELINALPNPIDPILHEEQIHRAEDAYNKLTDEQKAKVSNYDILEQALQQVARTQKTIAFEEAMLEDIAITIKVKLRNPDSYQENSYTMQVYEYNGAVYGYISMNYSAQNGFGGYEREYESAYYVYHGTLDSIDADTFYINNLQDISESEFEIAEQQGTKIDG